MPWYNSGDWSNAGGQDLPYIIAELWTAINQRQFVTGKILNPLESDSWVNDNYVSELPDSSGVKYPTAADLVGKQIHTPSYVNAIKGILSEGIFTSNNLPFQNTGWLVNPNTFEFYVNETTTNPFRRHIKDDVSGSDVYWFDEDPPFVFYLPFWDTCRRTLDRLKYMCVNFNRASYYWDDQQESFEPVTFNDGKAHKTRSASTWPSMLNESFSDISTIRNDARLQANYDGGISEQRDAIEMAGFAYSLEETVNLADAWVQYDFPFGFTVSAAWGTLVQRRRGTLIDGGNVSLAESLFDASSVNINLVEHSGSDLTREILNGQNYDYINTAYAGAQLVDGLVINPQIDWNNIPSSTAFDNEGGAWSWICNFYLCARMDGTPPQEAEEPLYVVVDISSELDDQ